MSRKCSIRIPDAIYQALREEVGESSLSQRVNEILKEKLLGNCITLMRETILELQEYSERREMTLDEGIERLLQSAVEKTGS